MEWSDVGANVMPSKKAERFTESTETIIDALRSDNRRLTKHVGNLERKLRVATTLRAVDARIPKWTAQKRRSKALQAAPVLLLSDWHFGETVDLRVMDGWNEYDDAIAKARWERVINQTPDMVDRHMHGYGVPFAVVALVGDMLSGDIHDELAKTNHFTTPRTVSTWVPRIAAGLRHLADTLPTDRIIVPCVDGNHDRLDKRTPMKRRAESSLTWIIYQWVADQLRDDDRFHFVISQSSDVRLPIFDEHHLFVHGDAARGGGGIGGIWPPIMRYTTKLRDVYAAQQQPIDQVNMGHFHQYVIGRGFLVNGSGKGYDEYARRSAFAPEPAQQALYAVAPDRGVIFHAPVHAT